MDHVQHGPKEGESADTGADGDNSHILNTGVGQHPFVIILVENEYR